jgi:DnaJ-class molecular chaperone
MCESAQTAKMILEVPCERCKGAGGRGGDRDYATCCACGGRGYIPTTFGEQILALVRRNSWPLIERVQNGDD